MSRESTAMVLVSPRTIGPWGDRAWRVAGTIQLVEGSQPYWIATPTQPAEHKLRSNDLLVEAPHPEAVTESLLMILSTAFGGPLSEQVLVASHNLDVSSTGEREIAIGWDLSAPDTIEALSKHLSQQVRLGVVMLNDLSLMTAEVINQLRSLGFDVDVLTTDSESANL